MATRISDGRQKHEKDCVTSMKKYITEPSFRGQRGATFFIFSQVCLEAGDHSNRNGNQCDATPWHGSFFFHPRHIRADLARMIAYIDRFKFVSEGRILSRPQKKRLISFSVALIFFSLPPRFSSSKFATFSCILSLPLCPLFHIYKFLKMSKFFFDEFSYMRRRFQLHRDIDRILLRLVKYETNNVPPYTALNFFPHWDKARVRPCRV